MFIQTSYGKIPENELVLKKIPECPKIVLNNYLNLFYDREIDSKTRLIKIYDKKIRQIGEINGENINEDTFRKSIYMGIDSSPHKIKVIKYLNPKLAYFLGYFYGDGGLKDIRRSYKISGKHDHKMILGDEFRIQIEKNIIPLVENIFNIHVTLRLERIGKGQRLYYINPTSKIIYRYLTKLFELNEGPKKNLKIPKIILDAGINIRKWFVRGFIDADGDTRASEAYINNKISSPRIKIRIKEKELLIQLQEILNKDFKFGFTRPYSDRENEYYIQTGKKDLLMALKENLFIHPIKSWRLKRYIKLMGT